MFSSAQERRDPANLSDHGEAESADTILIEFRALRRRMMDIWQQRGVMLTSGEQKALRDEINETCSLLTDLTRSS